MIFTYVKIIISLCFYISFVKKMLTLQRNNQTGLA